jgi:tetratricopeptide (TPR) repeat protein
MKRLLVSLAALSLFACSTANAPAPPAQDTTTKELPITSKSPEAVEHFKKGRDLAENLRQAEAVEELNQAIKLDPDFALALAYRGAATGGPEGLKDMEQANAKATSLSKPEQLWIAAELAGRRGEFAKSEDLWKQVVDALPEDWRAHANRGNQLYVAQKYPEAIEALNKATAINPNAGPVFNMIGYAHLIQGETGPAIEALKKYAALNPNEPNPQDSLGEALMAAGQFSEAEAAFRKAASLSPSFHIAWEGVAYTKFFTGNWAAGREALSQARAAAPRASDRIAIDRVSAMATLAEGKIAEALKQIDAVGSSPDASVVDAAFTPVYRALALVEGGRYREARAGLEKASSSFDKSTIPPGAYANLLRFGVAVCSTASGLSGDVEGAKIDVATIDKEAVARPDHPLFQSTLHMVQGMLAVAQKDLKTARMHFDLCSDRDTYCQWQSLVASQRAGDKAGADASRAKLTKIYLRDPVYLVARTSIDRKVPRQTN